MVLLPPRSNQNNRRYNTHTYSMRADNRKHKSGQKYANTKYGFTKELLDLARRRCFVKGNSMRKMGYRTSMVRAGEQLWGAVKP